MLSSHQQNPTHFKRIRWILKSSLENCKSSHLDVSAIEKTIEGVSSSRQVMMRTLLQITGPPQTLTTFLNYSNDSSLKVCSHRSLAPKSAYTPYHSTETALLLTLNIKYEAADNSKPTILVSLDLRAAFDTIDHSLLLSRLQTSFGVTSPASSLLVSYLSYPIKLSLFILANLHFCLFGC